MSGEDLPPGQSLRSRMFAVGVAPGDVRWADLSARQSEAAGGRYALAMASYIRWLGAALDDETLTSASLIAKQEALRDKATGSGTRRRTPDVIASLAVGWAYWLDHALAIGAISADERSDYADRVWKALLAGVDDQAEAQAAMSPAEIYRAALISAVSAGRAYVTALDGSAPETPAAWGWETTTSELRSGYAVGDPDREDRHRPRPGAARIGWVEGTDLYLEPGATYEVVVRHAAATGLPALPTEQTMRKRLDEASLLASVDTSGKKRRLTVRKTVDGGRRAPVLHLNASVMEGAALPAHPAQPAHGGGSAATGNPGEPREPGEPGEFPLWASPDGDAHTDPSADGRGGGGNCAICSNRTALRDGVARCPHHDRAAS
jgi:hypothetical protein